MHTTTNTTGGAPALRLPRQASPVHRGLAGGALPAAGGVEADNIFDDILGAIGDAADWLADHPAVMIPLAALLL